MIIFVVVTIVLGIGIYAIVRLTADHTRDMEFYEGRRRRRFYIEDDEYEYSDRPRRSFYSGEETYHHDGPDSYNDYSE